MHFAKSKFRLLAVVEAVLYQIVSSFPNGLPRIIETTLTFREIVRPYRTITISDFTKRYLNFTQKGMTKIKIKRG